MYRVFKNLYYIVIVLSLYSTLIHATISFQNERGFFPSNIKATKKNSIPSSSRRKQKYLLYIRGWNTTKKHKRKAILGIIIGGTTICLGMYYLLKKQNLQNALSPQFQILESTVNIEAAQIQQKQIEQAQQKEESQKEEEKIQQEQAEELQLQETQRKEEQGQEEIAKKQEKAQERVEKERIIECQKKENKVLEQDLLMPDSSGEKEKELQGELEVISKKMGEKRSERDEMRRKVKEAADNYFKVEAAWPEYQEEGRKNDQYENLSKEADNIARQYGKVDFQYQNALRKKVQDSAWIHQLEKERKDLEVKRLEMKESVEKAEQDWRAANKKYEERQQLYRQTDDYKKYLSLCNELREYIG